MNPIDLKTKDRFWSKVSTGEKQGPLGDCREWQAAQNGHGYGVFGVGHKNVGAHRFAYEMCKGPIAPGLFVLHECDNRKCVNPAHLFTGTNKDNVEDMLAKGRHAEQTKTHCPQGHEYTAENIYLTRKGARRCKACHKLDGSRRYHSKTTAS